MQDLPQEKTTSQSVGSFNHSEEHHEHPSTHGLKTAGSSNVEHFSDEETQTHKEVSLVNTSVVIETHEPTLGNTSSGSQNLGVVDEDLGTAADGTRDTEFSIDDDPHQTEYRSRTLGHFEDYTETSSGEYSSGESDHISTVKNGKARGGRRAVAQTQSGRQRVPINTGLPTSSVASRPQTESDDFHDRDARPATASPIFPRHSPIDVSREPGNGDGAKDDEPDNTEIGTLTAPPALHGDANASDDDQVVNDREASGDDADRARIYYQAVKRCLHAFHPDTPQGAKFWQQVTDKVEQIILAFIHEECGSNVGEFHGRTKKFFNSTAQVDPDITPPERALVETLKCRVQFLQEFLQRLEGKADDEARGLDLTRPGYSTPFEVGKNLKACAMNAYGEFSLLEQQQEKHLRIRLRTSTISQAGSHSMF